ncbi:MAG: hypothetical protein WA696_15325 [Solirubrobacterales bacterium]
MNSVDVVEDHGNHLAAPDLALTAELADWSLDPRGEQTTFEVGPVIAGSLHQDLSERYSSRVGMAPLGGIWIEVVGVDSPAGRILPNRLGVSSCRPVPKAPESFGP